MNKNLIIVMAGGFVIALLVAFMVQASLGGKSKSSAPKVEEKVQIVVAAKDLTIGTQIKDEDVKWQDWPKSGIFPGAFQKEGGKKASEVAQGRLLRAVKQGEPIASADLVKEGHGNMMAASLDDTMVATAIPINAQSMAGGFIGPGDYVDILLTYRPQVKFSSKDKSIDDLIKLNLNQFASEIIMQNIRVLAVDQTAARHELSGDDEGKHPAMTSSAKVGKTVTLEVTRRGAEMLAIASTMGTISLVLRKLGDGTIYPSSPDIVTDERITSATREMYGKIQSFENSSGQNANFVRFYNGYNVSAAPVAAAPTQ